MKFEYLRNLIISPTPLTMKNCLADYENCIFILKNNNNYNS